MKVDQSTVVMNASHEFTSEREVCYESTCNFQQVFAGVQASEANGERAAERETQALLMIEQLIQRMLELVFGTSGARATDLQEIAPTDNPVADGTARPGRGQLRFEVTTRRIETLRENEATAYCAEGTVTTKDGKSVRFDLDLDMKRTFSCTRTDIRSETVELHDPLVLNFDGNACELSGKRFAFDLDVDGKAESIPELASGSGFLAIDRNQDGRISDGSELFGTRSGDGFADLSAYDLDGNGWIDESDPVYDKLRIWRPDGEGADKLQSLREAGVGAVYLGSEASAFKLADADGRTLGQIRSSGVYLRENGVVGSIQQVDLSV